MNEQINPSVSIIGCGGCGCNLIKKIQKALSDDIKSKVSFKVIDTAKSNFSGLEDTVEIISIGELGSGKDRSKNANAIRMYFDGHPEYSRKATDITILIGSFAGGSGSNISPILTERILRHDDNTKAVIIVGVVDASSERDCLNSITTLKSFNKIAKDLAISLPMLLFSNTMKVNDVKPGKFNVDRTATSRVCQLINLLVSSDIAELDYADRMAYLRPQDSGCENGLCSLSISATSFDNTQILPGEINIELSATTCVHSMLVVNDSGVTPDDLLANVAYVGVSASPYISIISEGIPPALTHDLVDAAEWFQHSAKLKTTLETDLEKYGKEDKSGLIM